MSDQSITLKIAGKEYLMKASSPEAEQRMRLGAEDVNAMLNQYNTLYPSRSETDKLVFVALNEAMGKIALQQKGSQSTKEAEELTHSLEAYLTNIESNR